MTPEQIEKWAREAGFQFDKYGLLIIDGELDPDVELTEFARLVAADTWERAAKVCLEAGGDRPSDSRDTCLLCAAQIEAAAAKEPRP